MANQPTVKELVRDLLISDLRSMQWKGQLSTMDADSLTDWAANKIANSQLLCSALSNNQIKQMQDRLERFEREAEKAEEIRDSEQRRRLNEANRYR